MISLRNIKLSSYIYKWLAFFIVTISLFANKLPASELSMMSLDEKLGMLFIVAHYPNPEEAKLDGQSHDPWKYVEDMITNYKVTNILVKKRWNRITTKWNTEMQQKRIQHLRSISTRSLLIFQDLEWGLTQRLEDGLRFPKNLTLGAIEDNNLLYRFGKEVGREASLVGVDCDLAPVVDVNSNPQNPIIGDRSFGDNPEKVAKKAIAVMSGLQEAGIIPCAKHFPGHGDTTIDSHEDLPIISRSKKELKQCDLIPFQKLILAKVPCIMSAHIVAEAFDQTQPATLSKPILTNLLQDSMGFKGVIISDDLAMDAISKHHSPKDAALLAFQAGCDLIMASNAIPECINALKVALQQKVITEKEIDAKVQKIISLRNWREEHRKTPSSPLFTEDAKRLKKELYSNAITALNFSPLTGKTIHLQIGGKPENAFQEALHLPVIYVSPDDSSLLEKVSSYDNIIVSFNNMSRLPKNNYGISPAMQQIAKKLEKEISPKKIVFVFFGSPYATKFLEKNTPCIIAYEDDPDAERAAALVIQGKQKAEGRLPIK